MTGWSNTEEIDRIRRANAQRHVTPIQASNSSQKFCKNLSGQKARQPYVYFNDNSCNFQTHYETKGVFIDIYAVHALPRMVRSVVTVP